MVFMSNHQLTRRNVIADASECVINVIHLFSTAELSWGALSQCLNRLSLAMAPWRCNRRAFIQRWRRSAVIAARNSR